MPDKTLPPLGAAIRKEWALDPDFLTVNHGSFGASPLKVLAAAREWQRRLEAQPTRFMQRELFPALRAAATRLAEFLGGQGSDLVFVENTTVGCNAVLRSLRLQPGDEILMWNHGYNAVRNAARHVVEAAGARFVEVPLPFPRPDPDAIVAAFAAGLTDRTRLAIVDHITSQSAIVLPLERLVAAARSAGVPVLVDGAHGPGMVTIDLAALGADYYVGNGHKWLMAPKGAAFLWTAPACQEGLHPVTISHGYGKGYLAEFDWTGTRDPSSFLAVPAAIEFHEALGGAALRARNRAMADRATSMLVDRLGTERGAASDLSGAMGLIRLPVGGPPTQERLLALRGHFLDRGTDAPVHINAGTFWLRLSAAAYNEDADFERLAEIAARVVQAEG